MERVRELEGSQDPDTGGDKDRWRKSSLTWQMSGRRAMEMGHEGRVEVG